MNCMIHPPRFLCICNYFCFAGIVLETNCTPPSVKEMFVFLGTSVYNLPYNLFTFFSVCSQSSFCNGVVITCSIHGEDELYSCKEESLRDSSFLVE